jgi:ribonuclease HI
MKIEAYFDGACGPMNPGGHAAWGAYLLLNGMEVWHAHGYVGYGPRMSNNVAEYAGVVAVLRQLRTPTMLEQVALHGATVRGDSMLVIKQMRGAWKAKSGLYYPYYEEAEDLRFRFPLGKLRWEWVPRGENERADELSKQPLMERGVTFFERAGGKSTWRLARR